jgi:hypothetical protein
MRDPARLGSLFVDDRDAHEASWLKDPPPSAEAFAEGDRHLAVWTALVEAEPVTDRRPGHVRRYWARRDRRAGR